MTSTARHIDQSARMVWLSLRRAARPMTVNELVMHWKPVFDAVQMEDCLNRLTATGHASAVPSRLRAAWQVTEANPSLPGYGDASNREWCRTGATA
ncbi:hypothetical protein [Polaromonas sp. UC242_47]|uniref:hypothetical protein n=1 Tax=Polaromonas sp. UC242_47 TaxID=3374626 RepID=UPI003797DFC9